MVLVTMVADSWIRVFIDDDETEIKTIDLGESVHVMYVKNKHHHIPPHTEYEYENADDQAHLEESCCFKRSPFE